MSSHFNSYCASSWQTLSHNTYKLSIRRETLAIEQAHCSRNKERRPLKKMETLTLGGRPPATSLDQLGRERDNRSIILWVIDLFLCVGPCPCRTFMLLELSSGFSTLLNQRGVHSDIVYISFELLLSCFALHCRKIVSTEHQIILYFLHL